MAETWTAPLALDAECYGCVHDRCSMRDHMGVGGCQELRYDYESSSEEMSTAAESHTPSAPSSRTFVPIAAPTPLGDEATTMELKLAEMDERRQRVRVVLSDNLQVLESMRAAILADAQREEAVIGVELVNLLAPNSDIAMRNAEGRLVRATQHVVETREEVGTLVTFD